MGFMSSDGATNAIRFSPRHAALIGSHSYADFSFFRQFRILMRSLRATLGLRSGLVFDALAHPGDDDDRSYKDYHGGGLP